MSFDTKITFVKYPGPLKLQKVESCGWKCDPNLILQEVLVEITGKFIFLIVFSRFFQMFSHVFWLDSVGKKTKQNNPM